MAIETMLHNPIAYTLTVSIEGKLFNLHIAELQETRINHFGDASNNTVVTPQHISDDDLDIPSPLDTDNNISSEDLHFEPDTNDIHHNDPISEINKDILDSSIAPVVDTEIANSTLKQYSKQLYNTENSSPSQEQPTRLGNLLQQDNSSSSGSKAGKWDYRTNDSQSITSLSNATDYQAETLHIADVSQPIHKSAQLSLCKGLFGMHIRQGRGRPKKFDKHNKAKTSRITRK